MDNWSLKRRIQTFFFRYFFFCGRLAPAERVPQGGKYCSLRHPMQSEGWASATAQLGNGSTTCRIHIDCLYLIYSPYTLSRSTYNLPQPPILKKTANMSEVAFIKSFLSSLDSRPIKLRADYVLDEERVGPRVPVRPSPRASLLFPMHSHMDPHNPINLTIKTNSTSSPASAPRTPKCPRKCNGRKPRAPRNP